MGGSPFSFYFQCAGNTPEVPFLYYEKTGKQGGKSLMAIL